MPGFPGKLPAPFGVQIIQAHAAQGRCGGAFGPYLIHQRYGRLAQCGRTPPQNGFRFHQNDVGVPEHRYVVVLIARGGGVIGQKLDVPVAHVPGDFVVAAVECRHVLPEHNGGRQVYLVGVSRAAVRAGVGLVVALLGGRHRHRCHAVVHKLQARQPLPITNVLAIVEIGVKLGQGAARGAGCKRQAKFLGFRARHVVAGVVHHPVGTGHGPGRRVVGDGENKLFHLRPIARRKHLKIRVRRFDSVQV